MQETFDEAVHLLKKKTSCKLEEGMCFQDPAVISHTQAPCTSCMEYAQGYLDYSRVVIQKRHSAFPVDGFTMFSMLEDYCTLQLYEVSPRSV